MTSNFERPRFDKVFDDRSLEDLQLEDEARFEDAVTAELLKRLHADNRVKRQLLDENKATTGKYRLSLAGFFLRFPTFPVVLHARKLPKLVADVPVHRLFESFEQRCFVKAYRDLGEADRPQALVFFWPYLKQRKTTQGGSLVLHSLTRDDSDLPGTRITSRQETGVFHLEPLWRFLDLLDLDPEAFDYG